MIHKTKVIQQKERVILFAEALLGIIDSLIYIGSFTLLTSEFRTKFIFSDFADT